MNQLKFTFFQSVKLFLRTALPYKNFDYYRRYFITVDQVSTVHQDSRTINLYLLYACFLAYFALLNVSHFFLPYSHFTRVLCADGVAAMRMDLQFNLVFAGLIAYSIFLNWALYFKMNPPIHVFVRQVFLETDGKKANEKNLAPFLNKYFLFYSKNTTILDQKKAFFRFLSLLVINFLQVFIFLLNFCFFIFAPLMVVTFLRLYFSAFNSLSRFPFYFWSLLFFVQLPFHLFHIFLNFVLWYTFAHGLILLAVIGTLTITALYFLFWQNYIYLKKALKMVDISRKRKLSTNATFKRNSYLIQLLRRNVAHFCLVFAFDAYYGWHFLVYLGLHMPTSAYFVVQILFNWNNQSSLSLLAMIGLSGEAFTGTLFIHLYCAHFSTYIHRAGKWLIAYTATNSGLNALDNAAVRDRFLMWTHINRLVVKKKYGVTYYGKMFFKVF